MSVVEMKKYKGRPTLSKYWSFGPKGIKPKAGYVFLVNGKGQLITWNEAEEAKPNPDKKHMSPDKGEYFDNPMPGGADIVCMCSSETASEGDVCKIGSDEYHNLVCVLSEGDCTCEKTLIFALGPLGVWTKTSK